jgi:hypothetical protein
MTLSALAIEALANAVGSRVVADWVIFERLSPLEKLETLATALSISYDTRMWSAVTQLARFRNDIAHPKPELIKEKKYLPEVGLRNTLFDSPQSQIERQISLGNAERAYKAICTLKAVLADSLPGDKSFGIYADMWLGTTTLPHRS